MPHVERMHSLDFPPDWTSWGIFTVMQTSEASEGRRVHVQDRFTAKVVLVEVLDQMPFDKPDDLFIEYNWDAIGSLVVQAGSRWALCCATA